MFWDKGREIYGRGDGVEGEGTDFRSLEHFDG
jgi:hypothetical protein